MSVSFLDEKTLERRLRALGWFWFDPMSRYERRRRASSEPPLTATIGQKPDGAIERVRTANSTAGRMLLMAEHDALAKARHENLAAHRWTGIYKNRLFVATSWLQPPDETQAPIPLLQLLRQIASAARGVAALHDAGLVHGDLKPSTILRDEDRGLVVDLKLARPPGPRADASYSPKYAAPEQILEQHVGPQADVYALGVTLYELFIRNRFPTLLRASPARRGPGGPQQQAAPEPLSAVTSIGEFMNPGAPRSSGNNEDAIVGGKVMFRSQLANVVVGVQHAERMGAVLEVIRRACDMNPRRRYADASEFAAALERLCGDDSPR